MQAERAAAAERPWQSAVYLGMLLFLVSEAFLFGSLFWIYYYLKDNTPIWPPAGVDFGRALAVVNTAILLASSGTMYLATRAIRRGSLEGLVAELTVTFLLGALFLFNTGWEWWHLEFRPWDHAYGSIFFTMTGFHGLHVFAGLLIMLALASRALRGRFSPQRHLAVEVGGLYWHFVDLVWLGVFSTLFIIR